MGFEAKLITFAASSGFAIAFRKLPVNGIRIKDDNMRETTIRINRNTTTHPIFEEPAKFEGILREILSSEQK